MTATPSWQEILDLLTTWSESGLDSASLEIGDFSFHVSRTAAVAPSAPPARSAAAGAVTPPESPTSAAPTPAEIGAGTPVTAPMIGVFYRSPAPGKPPFVEPGARVDEQTTIGLIEVMKLMCPVVAGVAGVVAGFDVADGQQVEFGQVLARIEAA